MYFKCAIPGIFFCILRCFYKQLTLRKCSKYIADEWIQTRVLCGFGSNALSTVTQPLAKCTLEYFT